MPAPEEITRHHDDRPPSDANPCVVALGAAGSVHTFRGPWWHAHRLLGHHHPDRPEAVRHPKFRAHGLIP